MGKYSTVFAANSGVCYSVVEGGCMLVKCPRCGKETEYESNEFRPFCSERCKLIDFGSWADEEYALPAENGELTDEDVENIAKALEGKQ